MIKIIGIDNRYFAFHSVTNYTYLFQRYKQYNKYKFFKRCMSLGRLNSWGQLSM